MVRRAAVLFVVVLALGVLSAVLIVNSLRVVQRVTYISQVKGTVEVKEPGERQFRPLMGDERVLAGTIVRTGKNAGALLHWVDGTRLQAGAETTLKVLECRLDKRTDTALSLFQLDVGRIWARVIRGLSADSKFEIRTPTATAGVRGTTFSVEVGPDGSTEIRVYEGDVEVQSGGQTYGVDEGHAVAVRGGGEMDARELSEEEQADAEEAGVATPLLIVGEPKGPVPAGQAVTIRGTGEPGAELTINGKGVPLEADGAFAFEYVPEAKGGSETLTIIETNARGVRNEEKLTITVE
jgi:hypothetical protein